MLRRAGASRSLGVCTKLRVAAVCIAAAPAVLLAAAAPRYSKPFVILLGILAGIVVTTTTAGFASAWIAVFVALPGIDPWLLAIAAAMLAFATLWWG